MTNPPLLRYYGGKHRDAHRIISQMPEHGFYVEPFAGGASILLNKKRSPFEVLNDLSGDVVNFFQVLRDRPNEIIRAIQLTPYSRLEKQLAYEPTDDSVERARRLYVRSWQGFGGQSLKSDSGWRFQYRQLGGENVVSNFNRIDHLWSLAARLKFVQIECDDAFEIIPRYGRNPDALLYVDPPYVASTRVDKNNYDYELTDEEHENLSELLHSVDAMVMLSGYDCDLYRRLYSEWHRISWESKINGNKRFATECLWLRPNCYAKQLPLFNLQQNEFTIA